MTDMVVDARRLRAFALDVLRNRSNDYDLQGDALLALAEELSPAAWKHWAEVADAAEDQWYAWRDPSSSEGIHADQVMTNGAGRIKSKYSSGLDFCPECQPLRFAEDVRQALTQASAP